MKREMVKEWLESARSDLQVMEAIAGNEDLTHMSAFHAQQAIEKVLKAYLEHCGKDVPKFHKIASLLQLSGAECDLDAGMASQLDELYIDSRYPGELGLLPYGKPTLEDAGRFQKVAEDLYRWMEELYDEDAR